MAHQFITMTTPSGNKYAVFAPDMLIPELVKNKIGMVNWENFNPNDKYFDDNGLPYNVSICDQIVEIYEHDIMETPDYSTNMFLEGRTNGRIIIITHCHNLICDFMLFYKII